MLLNGKGYEKNIKGFTLIELLAVVAVISLLFRIWFVVIFNVFDESDEILDEVFEKLILDAAEQYTIEYRNNNNWKKMLLKMETITSCIMIDSLINRVYFKKMILIFLNLKMNIL